MERFFVIDLDRTLIDTGMIARTFEEFLAQTQPELSTQLKEERATVEQTGGSYDIVPAIVSALYDEDNTIVDELLELFIVTYRDEARFFLPGACELLEKLHSTDVRYGVMTFGGRDWQETKMHLVGLDPDRAMIIDQKGKAGRVAAWQRYDGRYDVPVEFGGGRVDQVVLIDDKPVELTGLPLDGSAKGYLVRPDEQQVSVAQQGAVPAGVQVVMSLVEVVEQEL